MLSGIHNIHFIGIGGAGMSALAHVLCERGFHVSGSDKNAGGICEKLKALGAVVYQGHAYGQVNGADAVVISSAIHPDNCELVAAKEQGIKVMHRSDVLAELLNHADGVAVAGAHGKTTTSAMLSCIAAQSGIDPTIVIGGEVTSLGGNARIDVGHVGDAVEVGVLGAREQHDLAVLGGLLVRLVGKVAGHDVAGAAAAHEVHGDARKLQRGTAL